MLPQIRTATWRHAGNQNDAIGAHKAQISAKAYENHSQQHRTRKPSSNAAENCWRHTNPATLQESQTAREASGVWNDPLLS